MKDVKVDRRRFLSSTLDGAVGAVSFPHIVSSSALGREGSVAPSSRITMGSIGVGGMGTNNMRAFLSNSDVQVVAALGGRVDLETDKVDFPLAVVSAAVRQQEFNPHVLRRE